MAFRFNLAGVDKSKLGSQARDADEAKARDEKNALDKVMADVLDEHGKESSVFGPTDHDEVEIPDDVFVPTGAKRHFTSRQRSTKSGPGTLELMESYDNFSRTNNGPGKRFDSASRSRFAESSSAGTSANEPPKQDDFYKNVVAVASNMPLTIPPSRVKELFADYPSLKVTKLEEMETTAAPEALPTKCMKVYFEKTATAKDLELAMLQMSDKKYLGRGHYLHLDRYLGDHMIKKEDDKLPFGARWQVPRASLKKGFAPPSELGGAEMDQTRDDGRKLVVTVERPPDLPTLKLIHQTIEHVLLGGEEFEACLMEVPEIQEDERFAFLYDQTHPLNRYYRWRMYHMLRDDPSTECEIFEGIIWEGPPHLEDEFVYTLGQLDHPYDEASDDEDEQPKKQWNLAPGDSYPGRIDNGYGILPVRSRAMLIWLFCSLEPRPATNEDIAAFSQFAVEHVGKGMDEIVHLMVANILDPFYLTMANQKDLPKDAEGEIICKPADVVHLTVNAMKIISDLSFTTSTEPGNAYKYRTIINNELIDCTPFTHLDNLPSILDLGIISEKNYRAEINYILNVWKEEHLFDKESLKQFDDAFNARTRQQEEEKMASRAEEKRKKRQAKLAEQKAWRSPKADDVEENRSKEQVVSPMGGATDDPPVRPQSSPSSNAPSPMEWSQSNPAPEGVSADEYTKHDADSSYIPGETAAARALRLRPRAEDMFASDEE